MKCSETQEESLAESKMSPEVPLAKQTKEIRSATPSDINKFLQDLPQKLEDFNRTMADDEKHFALLESKNVDQNLPIEANDARKILTVDIKDMSQTKDTSQYLTLGSKDYNQTHPIIIEDATKTQPIEAKDASQYLPIVAKESSQVHLNNVGNASKNQPNETKDTSQYLPLVANDPNHPKTIKGDRHTFALATEDASQYLPIVAEGLNQTPIPEIRETSQTQPNDVKDTSQYFAKAARDPSQFMPIVTKDDNERHLVSEVIWFFGKLKAVLLDTRQLKRIQKV